MVPAKLLLIALLLFAALAVSAATTESSSTVAATSSTVNASETVAATESASEAPVEPEPELPELNQTMIKFAFWFTFLAVMLRATLLGYSYDRWLFAHVLRGNLFTSGKKKSEGSNYYAKGAFTWYFFSRVAGILAVYALAYLLTPVLNWTVYTALFLGFFFLWFLFHLVYIQIGDFGEPPAFLPIDFIEMFNILESIGGAVIVIFVAVVSILSIWPEYGPFIWTWQTIVSAVAFEVLFILHVAFDTYAIRLATGVKRVIKVGGYTFTAGRGKSHPY